MDTETLAIQDGPKIRTINDIERKMHFTGTVLKTTLAGAVIDIGIEVPGVVHISQLQTQPVKRVEDVLQVGQTVDVWVRRVVPKKQRLELTLIKPLDLEWREIKKDMVLKGKVTRIEKFGVFVEIGAERPGLVHISEITHGYIKSPSDLVKEGEEVEVKVLEVNRQKRQIRLSMKALEEPIEKLTKDVFRQKEQPKEPHKEQQKDLSKKDQPSETQTAEEAIATSMGMAMREAIERSKEQEEERPVKGKSKGKTTARQIEDILERTLRNRSRSGK